MMRIFLVLVSRQVFWKAPATFAARVHPLPLPMWPTGWPKGIFPTWSYLIPPTMSTMFPKRVLWWESTCLRYQSRNWVGLWPECLWECSVYTFGVKKQLCMHQKRMILLITFTTMMELWPNEMIILSHWHFVPWRFCCECCWNKCPSAKARASLKIISAVCCSSYSSYGMVVSSIACAQVRRRFVERAHSTLSTLLGKTSQQEQLRPETECFDLFWVTRGFVTSISLVWL